MRRYELEIAANNKVWMWIEPKKQSESEEEVLVEWNKPQNISDIHNPTITNSGLPGEAK